MPFRFQRAVIGVERRLGFFYIPAKAQRLMPTTTGKVSVYLDGEKKTQKLTYNVDHKRIFGLTQWYKDNGIEKGTLLDATVSKSAIALSISKGQKKRKAVEPTTEKMIDISGLSSSAKGNIVEDSIKELILLYGQGLLNVYKPVVDNKGIDLIVMRDGVFTPIFLQVKSRFNAAKNQSLLIEVRDKTFTAHHSVYILGASFNPNTLGLGEKLLFVPSQDFKNGALMLKGYAKKRITVSLKEGSKAQWTKYLIDKSKLVEKLMEKFEEMKTYIK